MQRIKRRVGKATTAAVVATMALSGLVLSDTAIAQSTGASTTPSGSSTSHPSTFIFGDTSQPDSLNPMVGYLLADYDAWAMTYDIPINFGVKDFAPDFAHSAVTGVQSSPDNMTFTYTIRPNMKWSDGQPFTSSDFAWTLNYYKTNEISNFIQDVQMLDHVDAPDPTHFVIHTAKPTSLYSGKTVWMYDFILPEHIWSKMKDPQKAPGWPAVGSGPYFISDFPKGQSIVLERNPYYWGNDVPGMRPHFDRVIYQNFNDQNQEAAALQKGEIDFGYFDSSNILNSLKGKPNIVTHGAVTPFFEELSFNTGSSVQTDTAGGFSKHGDGIHAATDPAFRRVVREAVDDQAIVDKVLLGYGTPGLSPVPNSSTTGPWSPPAGQELPFNLQKAKTDLTAAGYTDTNGNGIVNDPVTGKDVVLRYFIRTEDQNTINTAPFVSSWLKSIGIGTKVTPMTNDALTNRIDAGTYDMFDWDWYPNPDPNSILDVFVCSERPPDPATYRSSDSYYCNPEYDALFKAQQEATDAVKRADIVHQMQDMLWRDMPYVVIYNAQTLQAYRSDRVTGFQIQPDKIGDLLAAYGPLSFISMHPPVASSGAVKKSSSSTIWIVVVIVVLLLAVVWFVLRSRRSEEDEA